MTPPQTQAAVAKLHADFCAQTGRVVPLRFHERQWYELLRSPEYAEDPEALGEDAAHLVRYLLRGISRGERNAGALKLINFLEPSKFFEDAAEARRLMKPLRPTRRTAASAAAPAEPPAPAPIEDGQRIAAELKKFREGLKG